MKQLKAYCTFRCQYSIPYWEIKFFILYRTYGLVNKTVNVLLINRLRNTNTVFGIRYTLCYHFKLDLKVHKQMLPKIFM